MSNLLQSQHACLINEGIGIAHGDGTQIDVPLHLEIPLHSPRGTPRILDVPELLAILNTVPSRKHSVVDVLGCCSAVVRRVHSALVESEVVNDLESHRDRADCVQPLSELTLVPFGNIIASVFGIADCDLRPVHALPVPSGVWVSR